MAEKKALIAMSGGVDSSVAAYLTCWAGYRCVGATLRLYDNQELGLPMESTCCSLEDVEDARSVAFRLGMPYYVFNEQQTFRREVMDKFARCYEEGRTPNPCIDCNRYLKFGALLHRAEILGCQILVTGHYARIRREGDRHLLYKAVDSGKDQSYVLAMLTQEVLAKLRFPLGELTKEQTRAIAREQGFVNAQKRDSQDICFLPDGSTGRTPSGRSPARGICRWRRRRTARTSALCRTGTMWPFWSDIWGNPIPREIFWTKTARF